MTELHDPFISHRRNSWHLLFFQHTTQTCQATEACAPGGLERDVLPSSTSPTAHSCFLQPLREAPLWGPGWSDLFLHTLVPLRNTAVEPLPLEGLWEAVDRSQYAQLDTSSGDTRPYSQLFSHLGTSRATLTAGDKGWVQRLACRAKRSGLRRPFLLVHASMWPRLLPHVWGVSLKDFLLS